MRISTLIPLLATAGQLLATATAKAVPRASSGHGWELLARQSTEPVRQFDSFCTQYEAACFDACLYNQVGIIEVVVACQKGPGKTSTYNFGCRCDGKVRTTTALKKVSGWKPTESVTETQTIAETVTELETTTSTETPADEVETSTETVVEPTTLPESYTTETQFVDETTTPVLDVTETALTTTTTTPGPQTLFTTVTSTTTSGATSVFTRTSTVSAASANRVVSTQLRVAVANKKGSSRVSSSVFCQAYARSCERSCTQLGSTIGKNTCKKVTDGSKSDQYKLYCSCASGKLRTQHALNEIGVNAPAAQTLSVTVLKTETTTAYSTASAVVTLKPKTTTTLTTITSTQTIPASTITGQATVTSTKTAATSTRTAATVTKVLTNTAATPTVTSTATTLTTVAPSRTEYVIAPTGRLRVENLDGSLRGYARSGFIGNLFTKPYENLPFIPIGLVQTSGPVGPEGPTFRLVDMRSPQSYGVTASQEVRNFPNDGTPLNHVECDFFSLLQYRSGVFFDDFITLGATRASTVTPGAFDIPLSSLAIRTDGTAVHPPFYVRGTWVPNDETLVFTRTDANCGNEVSYYYRRVNVIFESAVVQPPP